MADLTHRRPARRTPRRPADVAGGHTGREMVLAAPAFILLLTYAMPVSRVDELLDEHRAWLDEHFADGTFLVSGPQAPRTGGAILASGTPRAQIEAIVSTDPLARAGAATYEIVEFAPTRGPLAASAPAPKAL